MKKIVNLALSRLGIDRYPGADRRDDFTEEEFARRYGRALSSGKVVVTMDGYFTHHVVETAADIMAAFLVHGGLSEVLAIPPELWEEFRVELEDVRELETA